MPRLLEEDRLAAITLGKTIALILYSVLAPVFLLFVIFLPAFEALPPRTKSVIVLGSFLSIESIVIFLVFKGKLPGTQISYAQPFNEEQIAISLTTLSVMGWLFLGDTDAGNALRHVFNGALIVCTFVYFVSKSMLTRELRWRVLFVMILPLLNLLWR